MTFVTTPTGGRRIAFATELMNPFQEAKQVGGTLRVAIFESRITSGVSARAPFASREAGITASLRMFLHRLPLPLSSDLNWLKGQPTQESLMGSALFSWGAIASSAPSLARAKAKQCGGTGLSESNLSL